MYPNSAGYRPAQLAAIGIICFAAGLLLPSLDLNLPASALLNSLAAWFLLAAYLLYAVNIYDLRTNETRATAVLMLAIPLAVYWDGAQVAPSLAANPTAGAVSIVLALALGSIVSLALLWTLSTIRRGTVRLLLHRHDRRRHWPSATWVIVSVVVISVYAFASVAVISDPIDAAGVIQSISEGVENPQSPGLVVPTVQEPAAARTIPTVRQTYAAPARTANYQVVYTQVIVANAPAGGRQGATDLNAIEQAVFAYTNQERQQQGLPALQWDGALASVARAHSKDMAENNFFSHTNLRGQDPTARAVAAGYSVRRSLGGGWYSNGIGENIDKMPTGNVLGHGHVNNDPQSVAQAMVQAWMESPGHRENILHNQYARIGVGVAYDGMYYLGTQNFI